MDRGDVDLQKIDGKENLADPFTKAIAVRSSMTTSRRWILDTAPIGFRPSGRLLGIVSQSQSSVLENVSQKANRQAVDG